MAEILEPRIVRSYQQVRALCLLALIIVHAFSFSTAIVGVNLMNISYLPILFVPLALNGAFVFIAGITLRLSLSPENPSSDQIRTPLKPLLTTFGVLVFFEGLKNFFLYDSAYGFFVWDFLKTIFVCIVICILASRVHVYLNLFFAFLISWFFNDIFQFLQKCLWAPEKGWPNLDGLNIATLIYFGVAYGILGFLILSLARSKRPRLIRSIGIAFWLFWAFQFARDYPFDMSLEQFIYFRNWPIYILIGDPAHHTLFPLLATGPGFFIGFAGTHFLLKNKMELQTFSAPLILLGVTLAWVTLVYLLLFRHMDVLLSAVNTATWSSFQTDDITTFAGEVMKTLTFVFFFVVFYISTARTQLGATAIAKFGAASFWIYIVATTLTPLLARTFSRWTSSVNLIFLATTVVTLLASALVTWAADWAASKRLRIRFAEPKT